MAMGRAIAEWTRDLDTGTAKNVPLKLPYTSYGSMLLLPSNAFDSPAWHQVRDKCAHYDLDKLYHLIAKHLQVTHIAINRPIPLTDEDQFENALRAPRNFQPIWGDFGPEECHSPPDQTDFDAAFWVTARQNAIIQVWAPRWTMFSRGNISEKARLLTLASVEAAIQQGKAHGRGSAAVDLYAGIGYFTFSYLKAGVNTVLCWEINPWSTEGLRRGAAANKWSAANFIDQPSQKQCVSDRPQVLIFEETNDRAAERVELIRSRLPPIRHVNCGLLPTSRGSWQTALTVLDPILGGWIHVHENFDTLEIAQGAEAVRSAFQDMLEVPATERRAVIEDIHRVKSYAPGVHHCVIDLFIPASHPASVEPTTTQDASVACPDAKSGT